MIQRVFHQEGRRENRMFSPSLDEEDEQQLCIAAERQQPWPRRSAGDVFPLRRPATYSDGGRTAIYSGDERPATTDSRRRVCERARARWRWRGDRWVIDWRWAPPGPQRFSDGLLPFFSPGIVGLVSFIDGTGRPERRSAHVFCRSWVKPGHRG
jgi:hypothetical protein